MIKINNLVKKFNGKTVLNGINIEVKKGEVFGYLGPNGAGKTTTMRILLGLLKPTSGKALVFEKELGDNDDLRGRVGVLLDNDGLYGRLSAYENLDYYSKLYYVSNRKEKIENLLNFIRLSDRKNDKVGKFSTGMKRRLALAKAIIHDPEVLFMDEPTSGLDPEAQKMVRDLIVQLSKRKGIAIFLNSHNLDEVQKICSKIAILQKGNIRAYDTIKNLRKKYSKPTLEITLADKNNADKALGLLNLLDYIYDCEKKGSNVNIILKDYNTSEILDLLIKDGVKVEEVKKIAKSLEEIYLEIVRNSEEEI